MESLPQRKSIRLKSHDYYRSGWYYVTICTHSRRCLFGEVKNSQMFLNSAGEMVKTWWNRIRERFPGVDLDLFCVMPNHLHGIVIIRRGGPACPPESEKDGPPHWAAPTEISLPNIVRWFKTMTTNYYIRGVEGNIWPPFEKRLWQRNYYEHIIRDEKDLYNIHYYIKWNAKKWEEDEDNPINLGIIA